jgi:AraC family transcriptional regulator
MISTLRSGSGSRDPDTLRWAGTETCGGSDHVALSHIAPIRTLCAGRIRVVEARHPPGMRVAEHAHASASLTCVLRGEFETHVGASIARCAARSTLFAPAGELHTDHYGPSGAHCLLVEVPESRLHELEPATAFAVVSHVASASVGVLIDMLATEVRVGDELSPLAIEGLVLELLVHVGRTPNVRPPVNPAPWMTSVLTVCDTRFREPLVMAELAATAGVDPSHLAKVFRAHTGMTPSEYVRSQRVTWARSQLLGSTDSLATIALAAGFADQSHFTRSFRRLVGTSPGRFRDAARSARLDSLPSHR